MLAGSAPGPLTTRPAPRSILQSWERCAGMPADAADDPQGLQRSELQDRLARHAALLHAAAPDVENLVGLVAGARGLVLLADASGVILQAHGDTQFLHRAEQVALRPGVSWAEQDRGTNAIGTVLVEASPLRVHGREHFLARNQILSCHAAPIHSPRGELLGVLDISGDARRDHPYALGLATLGARQIANRLLQPGPRQHQLVFHRQAGLLDTPESGVLLVEDGQIVGANAQALALLGTTWSALLDAPVQAWLADWQRLRTEPRALRGTAGDFQATLQPAVRSPGRPVARAVAPPPVPGLPALAPTVQPLLARAIRAMDGELSVLVHGETGAGKEIFARHLHAASRWRDGPFVAVNCGALPESLLEAELFGYEPGAYTGARRHGARGLLREADGGVLFLDEIGDMPLLAQTRLLRVLQERCVQPLGAGKPVAVTFGVLSATHRDLHALMADGGFRPDLYYRLHDLGIDLPPLRAHPDLAGLIQAELQAMMGAGTRTIQLDAAACVRLCAHPWPGNYRQLRSVLRTIALFHPDGGRVSVDALPCLGSPARSASPPVAPPPAGATPSLRDAAHSQITQALARHQGNVSAAARELGVHRSTVYRRAALRRP